MNKAYPQKFRCKILAYSLGLALSGTATAADLIDWSGQVLLDGNPLSRSALSTSPSGISLTTQGAIDIGVDASGFMQLDGSGATWRQAGGDLVVGGNSATGGPGSGQLLINAGAQVTQTLGNVVIGQNLNKSSSAAGETGSALIFGSGSLLQIDGGDLIIGIGDEAGQQGSGEMTIADQARVIVNATQDRLTGGQVRLGSSGGKVSGGGTAADQSGTLRILNGGLLSAENVTGTNADITFDGGTLVLTGNTQGNNLLAGVKTTLGLKGATIDVEDPDGQYLWASGPSLGSSLFTMENSDPSSKGLTKTGAGTLSLIAPPPAGSVVLPNAPDIPMSRLAVRQGVLELNGTTDISIFPELNSSNALDLKLLELHSGSTFRDLSGPTPSVGRNQQLSLDGEQLLVEQHGSQSPGAVYQVGADKAQTLYARNASLSFTADALTSSPLLDVQGAADISNSTVNYSLALPSSQTLAGDATQTLLQTTGTLTADQFKEGKLEGRIGSTVALDISLQQQDNRLLAQLKGRATDGAKALAEGALGGVVTVWNGTDLAAGQGMESARQAASGDNDRFVGFGALSGGQFKDKTGSHIDTDGVSAMIGIARGFRPAAGNLTVGIFAEYGHGSYDTYNSFASPGSLRGSGNADYAGGGALARLDLGDPEQNHAYLEASARIGQLDNDYHSRDLTDSLGRSAQYDVSQLYYGAHVGLGYAFHATPRTALELYNRLFWTRVQGADTTLSTGERFNLDSTNSLRNRLGARLSYQANESLNPYVGLAWEHEFDGEVNADTNGYRIDAPTLKGDSGIAELGVKITPTAASNLMADLGIQAYSGRREGVSGSLRVRYLF